MGGRQEQYSPVRNMFGSDPYSSAEVSSGGAESSKTKWLEQRECNARSYCSGNVFPQEALHLKSNRVKTDLE